MADSLLATHLGSLQEDPERAEAIAALREASARIGAAAKSDERRLLALARQGHAKRGEVATAAALLGIEIELAADAPDERAELLLELARTKRDELLDDAGAREAFERALELRPRNEEIEDAIEQLDQTKASWDRIATRFEQEAEKSTDTQLRASLYARAASLHWQYGQGASRDESVDLLFQEALETDPASARTALLYEQTLRARGKYRELADMLLSTAEASRNRDEKFHAYVRAARVLATHVKDVERAALCYERVLDFAPGHPEALRVLVQHFTEKEQWDHLIALYEDALRARQSLESERGVLFQLAMVHWRIRNRPDNAEPHFTRLRKLDPSHPGMLSFFRELYTNDVDAPKLLAVLADAQRAATDPKARLDFALEMARVAERNDTLAERAIDAWKAVQRLDPTNLDASGALKRLYVKAEKWNALVDVLKVELDAIPASKVDERLRVLREMVAVYRDRLGLSVMVVSTYNAILALAPGDIEAIDALVATYEQMERWNELIQVLTKKADATSDKTAKIALLLRVANLWVERFTNFNQAAKPLEDVLALDPSHREALSKLRDIYSRKRAWQPLFDVMRKEADLASDPSVRLSHRVELAKLATERLHKYGDAIAMWREVVDEAPSTPGALDALEKAAEQEKDFESVAYAIEKRLATTTDDATRVRLLTKLGTIFGEQLRDGVRGAEAWKRILAIDPKNARALRTLREAHVVARNWAALEALYAETNDYEGLVDVLGSAADKATDAATRVELSFRAAELYETKLGDPNRAFRSYERVLAADAGNVRAASALLPIYERDEKWTKVADIFETLIAAKAVGPRGETTEALELRLRDLCVERLPDRSGRGFELALELARRSPEDDARLEVLVAAGKRAGKSADVAALLESFAEDAKGPRRLALLRRAAAYAQDELGEPERAVAVLEKLLADDPRDAGAIAVLDRVYRSTGRAKELEQLYVHRIANAADDVEKHVHASELAKLTEEVLDDAALAVTRYRAVLELDPKDRSALAALDRLAEQGQRWEEVAELVGRRRGLATDVAERRGLTLRLATLWAERLGDPARAKELFAEVLADDDTNEAAIAGLERVATTSLGTSVDVGALLEAPYRKLGRHEKLAGVLRDRLAAARDVVERRSVRLQLAALAEGPLGNVALAYRTVEDAFLESPGVEELWAELERVGALANRVEGVAQAFSTVLEAGDLSSVERVALARRAARLFGDVLDQPDAAASMHAKVLELEPLDENAFEVLKEHYTTRELWEPLKALYRKRIELTVDHDQKLALLQQLCFLFEEILDSPVEATAAYEQVLELDPDHAASRRALDRLYTRTERWDALIALLESDASKLDGKDAVEPYFRLGTLYVERAKSPARALECFATVLEHQPTHLRAQAALEALLESAELKQRAAAILAPLYDAQGAAPELVRVLEIQLEEIREPAARAAHLVRIASIRESRMHDLGAAFSAYSRAVAADPADPAARVALARLAEARGSQRDRAKVLEKAVDAAAHSTALQAELLAELAALWDELGEAREAEAAYEVLVGTDPDNAQVVLPALRALERLHLAAGAHSKLAAVLERQAQLETDVASKLVLLARLSAVLEETLGDTARTIAANEERLLLDPTELDALQTLERTFEKTQDWQRLAETLERHETVASDDDTRRTLLRRLAELHETRLGDPERAIGIWNDVIERFGGTPSDFEALARLYEARGRTADWLEVLERSEALESDPDRRAALRLKRAQVTERGANDLERAIELYESLLVEPSARAASLEALGRVLVAEAPTTEKLRAARIAAPHHEANGDVRALQRALETLAGSDDPAEAVSAMRRAAELAEGPGEDAGRAFELYARALRSASSEPDAAQLVRDVRRVGERTGRAKDVVEVLRSVVAEIGNPSLRRDVHFAVAELAEQSLRDSGVAREHYGKILADEPENLAALSALETLEASSGDAGALLRVLEQRTEAVQDRDERVALLLRRARIARESLGDAPRAIEAYEAALVDAESNEAYEGLVHLYEQTARWLDLGVLYERMLEKGHGDAADVRARLARLSFSRLDDAHQALEHAKAALTTAPAHADTVAFLESLLTHTDHRGRAAELLEAVYVARMDWPRLVEVLEIRAAEESQPSERKRLLLRLAEIREDHLEDLDAALDAYGRVFREDPSDRGIWDTISRLARVLEKWKRAAEVFDAHLADVSIDDPSSIALAAYVARIHEQELRDLPRATDLRARVLRFDPTDRAAFESLEAVLLARDAKESLRDLYREQADVAADDATRRGLLHKLAVILESSLADADRAIEAHLRVLDADPDDAVSVEALDRLYAVTARWADLAEHYRDRAARAASEPERHAFRVRLGNVLEARLGELGQAIDAYEEVVQADPRHGEAVAALEALVTHADHRARITQILEPVYRALDQWKKLVAVLEAQAELASEPADRVRLLTEVGALHETRGRDLVLAFDAWSRAFAQDPDDRIVRGELDRLGDTLACWDDVVLAYERALDAASESGLRASLLGTIARVHDEKRGDPRSAIAAYERLAKEDRDDGAPLDALEGLYTMIADWRGLVRTLEAKVERSYDPESRGTWLRQAGSVLEEFEGDRPAAISAYRRAFEENDDDRIALEALDRLFEAEGRAEELAETLRRRLDREPSADERVTIALRLGATEIALLRFDDAIEAYRRAISDAPGNAAALTGLAELYERTERWSDLVEVQTELASRAEPGGIRAAAWVAVGATHEHHLRDPMAAGEGYRAALAEDASVEPAVAGLLRLARHAEVRSIARAALEPVLRNASRWSDLLTVLEFEAADATDPVAQRSALRAIAEIHEQSTGDRTGALEAAIRALVVDAGDESLASEVVRLARSAGRAEAAVDALARVAGECGDPSHARALLLRAAGVAEADLKDDARAVELLERAVGAAGDDEELLARLDELLTRGERHLELAVLLERRGAIAAGPSQRAELDLRRARLLQDHLDDARGALDAYRLVLDVEPANDEAISGVRRLVQERSIALDAIEALENAFGASKNAAGLLALMSERVRLSDTDAERMRWHRDAMVLADSEANDAAAAFGHAAAVWRLDPGEPTIADEVERLALKAGRVSELAALAGDVAELAKDRPETARDVELRRGRWARSLLASPTDAVGAFRRALSLDVRSRDAHEALVDVLRELGDHEALVAALTDFAGIDEDDASRRRSLVEAATIAEERLAAPARALRAYLDILKHDSHDVDALDHALRLASACHDVGAERDLLERRIDAEPTLERRTKFRHRAAELASAQSDAASAVRLHRAVLDEDPANETSLSALEALFETAGDHERVREVLERRLDAATTAEERIAARRRLARVAEEKLRDRARAMSELREILAERPDDAEADALLERYLRDAEAYRDVAELLEARAARVSGSADERAILLALGALFERELEDLDRAKEILERLAHASPIDREAVARLIALYERTGDIESATTQRERLLEGAHDADLDALAYAVADACTGPLGNPARAEHALRLALARGRDRDASRRRLKALLEGEAAWDRVVELLREEESVASTNAAKAALALERAAVLLERIEDTAGAISALEVATVAAPENRDALQRLAALYESSERHAEAARVLESLVKLQSGKRNRDLALAHHRLAQAWIRAGEKQKALAELDQAFKIDLTHVGILRDLGKLCHETGDLDRAQKTFRALLLQKLDADAGISKADVYFYLGDIARQQGDTPKAVSMLERAIAEDSKHERASALLATLKA